MSRLILTTLSFTLCLACIQAHADASGRNAAGHAPIGVMGDHIHEKGEFMLSYRFMHMDMHMFGAMYAPADWLTLMVMGMYMEKEMEHTTYMGGMGTTVRGSFRLDENRGYSLGDKHTLSAWLNHQWQPFISTALRLQFDTLGSIDGMDPMIAGPVQTADPGNYGGDELKLNLGVNLMGQTGALAGHRLAVEASLPLYRDLNGPQMETDWTLIVGWQYAFE